MTIHVIFRSRPFIKILIPCRIAALICNRAYVGGLSVAITGLWTIVAVAILTGLIFGFFPELDLQFAALFFDKEAGTFLAREHPTLAMLRNHSLHILAPIVIAAIVAIVGKFLFPTRPSLIPGKTAIFLILALAIGPGLLINGILKPNSGRPRPIEVVEMNGKLPFHAWYDFSGPCQRNCSFASGEASAAFWALAPAALVPAPYRYAAIGAAVVYGTAVGMLRISFGGHFLSDVIFAAVFTALIVWLLHGYFFRWNIRNLSNQWIEDAFGKAGLAGYSASARLMRQIRGSLRPAAPRISSSSHQPNPASDSRQVNTA